MLKNFWINPSEDFIYDQTLRLVSKCYSLSEIDNAEINKKYQSLTDTKTGQTNLNCECNLRLFLLQELLKFNQTVPLIVLA